MEFGLDPSNCEDLLGQSDQVSLEFGSFFTSCCVVTLLVLGSIVDCCCSFDDESLLYDTCSELCEDFPRILELCRLKEADFVGGDCCLFPLLSDGIFDLNDSNVLSRGSLFDIQRILMAITRAVRSLSSG